MTNSISKDLSSVTDPSDWTSTCIPSLSQLDSLQRCYICKEYLKAPVITSCNHVFCSICIRQHLLTSSSCPLCKSEQFESSLRRVVVLEEIVNCFSNIRPILLKHLLGKEVIPKIYESNQNINEKRDHQDEDNAVQIISDDSEVTLISSGPSSPKRKADEIIKPVKKAKAECPICQKSMDAIFLQTTHIDSCLVGKSILPPTGSANTFTNSKKKNGPTISSFFKTKKSEHINHQDFYFNQPEKHIQSTNRLPKLDFNSLTTPKLKEKLSSINLSTVGTRNQLELRYNQYYILFNSNLDSNHPVDIKILKSKLSQWEASHSAFNSKSVTSLFTKNVNRSITDKNFSVTEWKRMYYMEFNELIKQAKKNIKKSENHDANNAKDFSSKNSQSSESLLEFKTNDLFVGDE